MAVRGTSTANGFIRATNYPTATSWTMMGWFYNTSLATRGHLLTHEAGGAGVARRLRVETNGLLGLWGGASSLTSGEPGLDTWFHGAMTYDGATTVSYWNGVFHLSIAHATTSQGDLYIGNDDLIGSDQWLNGRWAAIKIWNAVLTAAEIKEEMKQYVPVRKGQINTFSPCRTLLEAPINFNGVTAWTLGGTHGEEAGPPIPYALRLPRRVSYFVVTPPVQYDVTIASTTTPAGALVRQVNKNAGGVLAPIGTIVKRVSKTVSGVVTPVGSMIRQVYKTVGGVITPAGALVVSAAYSVALNGVLAVSGLLSKQISKVVEATITPAGRIAQQINKAFSGAIGISGSLGKQVGKVVGGVVTGVGTITALASEITPQVLAAAISIAGSISSSFIAGSGMVHQGIVALWRRRKR